MHCKKCNGKIFFEGVFGEDHNSWLELNCITCGKRWLLDINGGKYTAFVRKVLRHFDQDKYANIPG